MKKNITPLNREAAFNADELFFSVTDHKGQIAFGNDTFVRISGYESKELIDTNHNIIRHPDMPRAVFKLLWSTIKNKLPIAAYVKNMAKDGSYYWVFAFVFPVGGEYLSIRLKPQSKYFKIVQEVYSEALMIDKKSMDEALEFIMKKIKQLGFESYRDFSIAIAIEEINEHESYKFNRKNQFDSSLQDPRNLEIKNTTYICTQMLNERFKKVHSFQEIQSGFCAEIKKLNEEFSKLHYVAINMNVLTEKFGFEASSLSVVAEEFSKISNEISFHLKSMQDFSLQLKNSIQNLSLSLISIKTQMLMVEYFVIECLNDSSQSFVSLSENQARFVKIIDNVKTELVQTSHDLHLNSLDIKTKLDGIHRLVLGLEIIKLTGRIESSRRDNIQDSFNIYIKEMDEFLVVLKNSLMLFKNHGEHLSKENAEIKNSTVKIFDEIKAIFKKINQEDKKAA